MREVQMTGFKHDGRKHRHWLKLYELPGEPGVMWIEPHTPVVEANGKEWSSPFPVVYWVHPEKWYNIAVLCKEEGTAYYC
ncbi:MAG TPA: hypothetical protein VFV52_05710, partial [Bacilli bacterium]|nr:hypothetical protein [Bacilli bacterium]